MPLTLVSAESQASCVSIAITSSPGTPSCAMTWQANAYHRGHRHRLRRAEELFRRAIALKPDASETHLRLGRVLGRLGRHGDAAVELRQAVAAIPEDDSLLLYYGELFLGAEDEALGRRDAARASYEHAAALYPVAQSPLVALSQLAWRNGDRAGALRAIQQVFALRPEVLEREDPWWTYHVAQARNAETLLDEVRKPFLVAEPR